MFNAIIPFAEPIVAVQVDAAQLASGAGADLLARLETYFMRPVVLVAWDADARFISLGFPCPEDAVTSDDLEWRSFELPPEPEAPF